MTRCIDILVTRSRYRAEPERLARLREEYRRKPRLFGKNRSAHFQRPSDLDIVHQVIVYFE
jgi:hypothetical protein